MMRWEATRLRLAVRQSDANNRSRPPAKEAEAPPRAVCMRTGSGSLRLFDPYGEPLGFSGKGIQSGTHPSAGKNEERWYGSLWVLGRCAQEPAQAWARVTQRRVVPLMAVGMISLRCQPVSEGHVSLCCVPLTRRPDCSRGHHPAIHLSTDATPSPGARTSSRKTVVSYTLQSDASSTEGRPLEYLPTGWLVES